MSIIVWIIFGLIAGAIAKFLMPGKAPGGIIVTIVLGIVGAVVGGMIASYFGWGDANTFDVKSLIIAIGGAVLLLFVYGLVMKKK